MIYHFKVHKEAGGYWAECIELEGCRTEGDTMDELRENAKEALNVYLEEPEDSDIIFPMPKKIAKRSDVLAVAVEPSTAFAMLLRQQRLGARMTQKVAADKMGFKRVWQYQKLESPNGLNPTLDTIALVVKTFPAFSVSRVFPDDD